MSILGFGGNIQPGPVPVPSSYGLLSVLQDLVTLEDPHWMTGLQVETVFCDDLDSTLPDCPDIVIPAKEANRGLEFCDSDPFTIYSSFRCSPTGLRFGDRAFEIAEAKYDHNYERKVEQIFWSGITDAGAIEPALTSGNSSCGITVVDLSPTPTSGTCPSLTPTAAIATLESAIASCWPGQGVIHATFGIVPFLAERTLVHDKDGKLYTTSGTRVAAGAGYPGTGPGNTPAPPGTTWMYATSQIIAWRSPKYNVPGLLSEAVDRDVNDVTVRTETTWALSFVCCLFAVLVNINSDSCT